MSVLSTQAQEVLAAIVKEYIVTGDAVSSGAVVRRQQVQKSSAAIRYMMANLEDQGYLLQPHRSAGRIPTGKGLRFYVDRLMKVRELSKSQQARIREQYDISKIEMQQVLRDISHLLADLSKQCALVQVPSSDVSHISRIEFVPMGHNKLIVVLALSSGKVENRLIQTDKALTAEELEKIHVYLNELCSNRALAAVRQLVAEELEREEIKYDDLRRRALEVGQEALAPGDESELLIEGHSRLIDNPGLVERAEMVALLEAIEQKRVILGLLNETMSNAQGVKVFIGSETQQEPFHRCAMIAATYGSGNALGTLGVVGPSNIDYPRVIPIVSFAAGLVTEILRES